MTTTSWIAALGRCVARPRPSIFSSPVVSLPRSFRYRGRQVAQPGWSAAPGRDRHGPDQYPRSAAWPSPDASPNDAVSAIGAGMPSPLPGAAGRARALCSKLSNSHFSLLSSSVSTRSWSLGKVLVSGSSGQQPDWRDLVTPPLMATWSVSVQPFQEPTGSYRRPY